MLNSPTRLSRGKSIMFWLRSRVLKSSCKRSNWCLILQEYEYEKYKTGQVPSDLSLEAVKDLLQAHIRAWTIFERSFSLRNEKDRSRIHRRLFVKEVRKISHKTVPIHTISSLLMLTTSKPTQCRHWRNIMTSNAIIFKGFRPLKMMAFEEHFFLPNLLPKSLIRNGLCYLSPNAPKNMKEYSHDDVYIIGGYNDKSSNVSMSAIKAQQAGIRQYRLPLEKYVAWGASKRLYLEHVVGIFYIQWMIH